MLAEKIGHLEAGTQAMQEGAAKYWTLCLASMLLCGREVPLWWRDTDYTAGRQEEESEQGGEIVRAIGVTAGYYIVAERWVEAENQVEHAAERLKERQASPRFLHLGASKAAPRRSGVGVPAAAERVRIVLAEGAQVSVVVVDVAVLAGSCVGWDSLRDHLFERSAYRWAFLPLIASRTVFGVRSNLSIL